MATITKIKTKSGIRWKALIRRGNRSKSKTFQLKSSARAWAAEMERGDELAIALGSLGATITLSELATEYLEQYQGRDHSRVYRVRFWVERLGNTRLTDIKPHLVRQHLEDYASGRVRTYGGIGKDLKVKTKTLDKRRAPASVNRMKAALAALLAYAREKEYLVGPSVTSVIPTLKENNKRTRFLTEDERTRLLRACRASDYDRLYLLAILALTSGCRLGELITLRWSDIDFADKSIYLAHTKNDDPRKIPLARPALEELRKFRGIGEALVFPGKRRTRRPFVGFRKHWNEARKVADVADVRFHDNRHTVASNLAMKGYSLFQIGEILGHRSVQTTKRYAHLSTDHKREIITDTFDDVGVKEG